MVYFVSQKLPKKLVKSEPLRNTFVKIVMYSEGMVSPRSTPKPEDNPCRLCALPTRYVRSYSPHLQPSANWGSVMPRWQETHLKRCEVKCEADRHIMTLLLTRWSAYSETATDIVRMTVLLTWSAYSDTYWHDGQLIVTLLLTWSEHSDCYWHVGQHSDTATDMMVGIQWHCYWHDGQHSDTATEREYSDCYWHDGQHIVTLLVT